MAKQLEDSLFLVYNVESLTDQGHISEDTAVYLSEMFESNDILCLGREELKEHLALIEGEDHPGELIFKELRYVQRCMEERSPQVNYITFL